VGWELCGYVASGLVLAAFSMKDLIPLRLAALAGNLAFMAYGWPSASRLSGCCMPCWCRSTAGASWKLQSSTPDRAVHEGRRGQTPRLCRIDRMPRWWRGV